MINVLLADDHALLTDSLRIILENESEIKIIGTAYDGNDALEKCKLLAPDVVLMDIKMPLMEGIESARLIKDHCPNTRVAILTSLENSKYVFNALVKGVDGYLLKDTPPEILKTLIQCIHLGYFVLSDNVKDLIRIEILNSNNIKVGQASKSLKQEDIEIIRCISEGKSNQETGKILGYADGTIKNKISKLMEETGVEKRAQLVMYALKNDLL